MKLINEEKLQELIPDYMQGGLRRYIEEGIEPGGFLTAVLENNLKEAVNRADLVNLAALPNYVRYLYNYAPSQCWGSSEKVTKWITAREADAVARARGVSHA